MTAGRLLLGATPLGQPSDASRRLVDALGSADVVAAEDTRRVRTLAKALDVRIAGRVVSLFDQVEAARVPVLVGEVEAGATVLVVSDAGMPLDQRSRLPVGGGMRRGGGSGDLLARAVGGDHRAGRVRFAGGEVLLRGFRATQGGGAQNMARLAGRRASHLRVLRVAAPAGGVLA